MKWRRFMPAMTLTISLMVVLLGRLALGSYLEYRQAQSWQQKNEFYEAGLHYGRAIRWYFPANPWGIRSIDKLLVLAQVELAAGKQQQSYRLYQILQGALASVRSFYQPYSQTLAQTRQQLASLTMQLNPDSGL